MTGDKDLSSAKINKREVNSPCFICGSKRSDLFFEREFPEHGYPGTFCIRKCKGCGLLYNSPRLDDTEFPELYGKNYYFFNRTDENEFLRIVEIYRRTVSLIHQRIFPKKVLDIGSSKGYLLAALKQLGWSVQGVEISQVASQYATRKLGVPTFTGTVEEFAKVRDTERFPLVLAIDVLEHILYPKRFIESIHQIMQDDGFLIIDTPNAGSANICREKPSWKGFNPFHIFLFSKRDLMTLMEHSGYRVEKIFSYGNDGWSEEQDARGRPAVAIKHMVKNILGKANLLDVAGRVYQETKEWLNAALCGRNYLLDAVRKIEDNISYFETTDSVKPLAKDCRGDNMVLIARKG
jgi:2-polyprenyl-3-methyl-5-hydroxy-6-metoxy-1,4-benzoquinol methylase